MKSEHYRKAILLVAVLLSVSAGCLTQKTALVLPPGVERMKRTSGRIDYVIHGIWYGGTNATRTSAQKWNTLYDNEVFFADIIPQEQAYRHDWLTASILLYDVNDVKRVRNIYNQMNYACMVPNVWNEALLQNRRGNAFYSNLFVRAHANALRPLGQNPGGSSLPSLSTRAGEAVLTVHDECYTNNRSWQFGFAWTNGVCSLRQIGDARPAVYVVDQKPPDTASIIYDGEKTGRASANLATGAGGHGMFAVRVFDQSGEYIWQAENLAYARRIAVYAADVDRDGVDDIVICTSNLGGPTVIVFRGQNIENSNKTSRGDVH